MYEELYIIDNGKRLKVDLATPSGITLNFKSNIFGDLSKITCSYTYTFKLPLTANNRRVFDNADDIRCVSNKIRRRLKAEYIQNGIPLFKNANLYIESTENNFNAVMTWGVIDGFQTLKDDDMSIRKLDLSARPVFGPCNAKIAEYRNTADFVKPLYNAGLMYISDNGWKDQYNTYSVFPLPAIPVYRLIQLINSKYGTNFNLGSSYTYGDTSSNHNIIDLGVIPCVSVDAQQDVETEVASLYWTTPTADSLSGVGNVIKSPTNSFGTIDETKFRVNKDSSGRMESITNISGTAIEVEADGMFWANFQWRPDDYNLDVSLNATAGSKPTLNFYIGSNSVASVEGKYFETDSQGILCWAFKFSEKYGYDRVSFTIPAGSTLFLAFSCGLNRFSCNEIREYNLVRFYSSHNVGNIKWNEKESNAGSFEIDLMGNLPDISCLTLMKALFFMLGAFPSINSGGEIIPLFYTSLKDNVIAGNALDWSNKVTTQPSALPNKSAYNVSGFGQRNYYLMKNDNVDGDGSEDDTDVYASGIGIVYVGNEVIDRNKTIIQLPFYAPYIKNKKDPFRPTGNTMKFWYYENDEVKTKEAKPCFGMIKPFPQTTGGAATGVVWMGMDVWNGFPSINSDPSYSYLAKIIENPILITEQLMLNELDLRDIDYSVPVYLSKYGAFFAIVSITRDSKGICKCELLKLPEEE